ncbi:hydrogenase formation protein HypD [bacterium M21]|nr:hydrogenase formation protein HypD [bacterium M21]
MAPVNFADPKLAKSLLSRIHELAPTDRPLRIMEVCGTHTMEIGRLGLRALLPESIELLSGPGCPVCVTPAAVLDAAIEIAKWPNHTTVCFGDMIRVPGTKESLEEAQANGASVEMAVSPMQLIDLAKEASETTFVFIAVGFETTVPAIARTVQLITEQQIPNIRFLTAHRTLPAALDALCADADIGVHGFLLPGHVSAILGSDAYSTIKNLTVPATVTGFEPLDILGGIYSLVEMWAEDRCEVTNLYPRIVKPKGNPAAQQLINDVFEPCDAMWRGIGVIPGSGLKLRAPYAHLEVDPPELPEISHTMPKGCSCGLVLQGKIGPADCPLFADGCDPDHPVGPCMVSSEGSCAAWYRYERGRL